jgi:CRP/FNR family transcriptional regulator, cyclic AMP receptor protein
MVPGFHVVGKITVLQPKCCLFVAYLLARNIRYEEDLVDQLFNSSEKRLARVLLMLAHFGKEGIPETVVPRSAKRPWPR